MSFVPRSVSRGREDGRGGARGSRGGGRARGRGRGGGQAFYVDRGRGRNLMRGSNRSRGHGAPVKKHDKGPVKILHPDDPEHPNFLADKRNEGKIKQMLAEGRLQTPRFQNEKNNRSSKSPMSGSERDNDHDDYDDNNDQLYAKDVFNIAESSNDKFSDEGLRITVENKGGELSVADPSFYDEIQPRKKVPDKNEPNSDLATSVAPSNKTDKKMEYENISDTDDMFSPMGKKGVKTKEKLSPKAGASSMRAKPGDESIRITVGNDKFKSRDNDEKTKRQESESRKQKKRSPERRRRSPEEYHRKKGFRRSPSGSTGRRGSPSPWRKSRTPQISSRGRKRSRSRSRNRRTSRNRSRSYSKSGSKDNRSQSSSYSSYSSSSSSTSGRDSRSRSYSRERNKSGRKDSPKASLPPKSKWEDSPQRGSRWDSSPPKKKKPSVRPPVRPAPAPVNTKAKDNPFKDFLKDLDYNKLSEKSSSLPWMNDSSKATDVLEIERYLENKLKQAKVDKKETSEPNVIPRNSSQYSREMLQERPPSQASPRQSNTFKSGREIQNHPNEKSQKQQSSYSSPQEYPTKTRELSPNEDIYDTLLSQSRIETPPVHVQRVSHDDFHQEKKHFESAGNNGSKSQGSKDPVPGMASMIDIDDEDAFLYGDLEIPQPEAPKSPRKQTFIDEDSVYTGGYRGEDPGWEVAEAKECPEPDVEEPHKSPKVETETPVDPTIQNILKSIGFNFELSKLMQQKAEAGRKKEDVESYGIRQGSSFLGGGLKTADIKSALKSDDSSNQPKKQKEGRKSIDVKESYEERARRYREEQMKLYQSNQEGDLGQSKMSMDTNDESSKHSQDNYYNNEAQNFAVSSQPQYGNMGHFGNTDYQSDYAMHADQSYHMDAYQQQYIEPLTVTQSNLTVIQTVDCDAGKNEDLEESRLSALQRLQDVYHEEDRYTAVGRMGNFQSETANRDHEDDVHRNRDNMDRNIQESSQRFENAEEQDKQNQRESYERPRRELQDRKEEREDYYEKRRKLSNEDDRNYTKRDSRSHGRMSSYDGDDSHEVLKRRRSRSRDRSYERSPSREKNQKQIFPIGKSGATSTGAQRAPGEPQTAQMNQKEREHLMYELEDRRNRLKALDKELNRLRKQENELMRKQQRQKKGEKNKLLDENTQLQEEIQQQISILKSAAEVNAKLLLASRTGDPKDDDELLRVIAGQTAAKHKKKKKGRSDSPEPPAKFTKSKSPAPDKKVITVKPAEEKVKLKKMEVRYEYFDPGNHWCKQCNHVSSNCYEVFQHLNSKKHIQKLDPYDRPWMPESLKNPTKQNIRGQSVAAPLKGVEFMLAVNAFYCTLCKEFSGDMLCAEEHLKTKAHNEKYQKFLDENQFYERQYTLDKAAGLSLASSKDHVGDATDYDHRDVVQPREVKTMDEMEESIKRGRQQKEKQMADELRRQREERQRLQTQYEEQTRKMRVRAEEKKKHTKSYDDIDEDREKSAETKPKSFGNFKWKGKQPIIGKAPGFKKLVTSSGASQSNTSPDGDSGKIVIKLDGKSSVSKPSPPVEIARPAQGSCPTKKILTTDGNTSKLAKREDVSEPDPLEIFITGCDTGKHETITRTITRSNIDDIALPPLPQKRVTGERRTKSEVGSDEKSKVTEMSVEEREERRMLGIDVDESPRVAPKPPPPMALGANRPEQSMAATSAKKIYGVFFGDRTGEDK